MAVEFLQILLYSTCVCANMAQILRKKDTITVDDMKKEAEREARTMWQFVRTFLKWLVIAGVTGGIGGLVGSAFHLSVNWAAAFRAAHPWLLWLLPIGGLLIAAIYRLTKMENKNTNAIIDAIHFGDKVPLLLVPAIYLSTVITHLFGGSAGREGAALQIGGSLGCYIGQLFHLDEKDMRIATLCGMSAVFSALFGTPLTATIFALEVISVGVFYYSALVPCIVASLAALAISNAFGIAPTHFTFALTAAPRLLLLRVAALAAVCSLMSILFCVTMHGTERLFAGRIQNPWLRIAAGGDAQPRVLDAAGKEPLRAVHGHAKEDAHERAHGGERRHAQQQQPRRGRERERKVRRRDAEGIRDRQRRERRDDARHERGVIKHAHADDLEREDRRRQRRAEQGREHGAHAAERGDAHVLFIEVEQLPDVTAEAAADLQRSALAPGAAAEQVRNNGRQIDRRHEQQRHLVAEVDGVDDGVGVLVFHFGQAVNGRDEQAAYGQQPQQPRVRGAKRRRPVHAQVKGRADQPADAAGHARDHEPLEKRAHELPHGARLAFGLFFHIVHGDGVLFAQNLRHISAYASTIQQNLQKFHRHT